MADEQPIDIHHYTWAIHRALPRILVLALIAGCTAAVVSSLYTSKTYTASTTILAGSTLSPNQSADATTLTRSLATVNRLTATTDVLARAAAKLPHTTVAELRSAIHSSVDPEANVITIEATADTAAAAAARANQVAPALIATERRIEQQATADRLRAALKQVGELRSAGATRAEIRAAANRVSSLAANAAGSVGGFQVIQAAEPPRLASSAPPWFSGIGGFVAVVVLGMLVVLAREQVAPRISSSKDLDQVFSIPVLTSIPLFRRVKRKDRSLVAQRVRDSFYMLASVVRLKAEKHDAKIILVVSAIRGEGRTTVTANLSQALSMGGASVLAVCADFRAPTLHERLGSPQSPGLANVLASASHENKALDEAGSAPAAASITIERAIRASISSSGKLHVLPSGLGFDDPTPLFFGDAIPRVFKAFRGLPYDFVIVDTAPALGFPEVQALAPHADAFLTVVRTHRLRMSQAEELRDLLKSVDKESLGLVVFEGKAHPISRFATDGNGQVMTVAAAGEHDGGSAQIVGSRQYDIRRT
jgi:Mrp family chromosome partitioning ATPase